MANNESHILELLLQELQESLGWANFSTWKNYNYEKLNERINEKCQVNISTTTLKRLTGKSKYPTGNTLPRVTTLDALARFLDYKDWQDYLLQKGNLDTLRQGKPEHKSVKTSLIITLGCILITALFLLFRNTSFPGASKEFNLTLADSIIPGYAELRYKINKDCVILYDKEKRRIKTTDNYYKILLRYPGLKDIRIEDNDRGIWKQRVPVYTNDWICVLSTLESWEKLNYSGKDIVDNGIMSISKEISSNYFKNNYNAREEYILGKDFGNISLNDCIINARFRYVVVDGFDMCHKCYLILGGRKDDFSIPFTNIGCSGLIDYHMGRENMVNSRTHDISNFEMDMSVWRNVKIISKDQRVQVIVDGKLILDKEHDVNFGELFLINFSFSGHGEIDFVNVSSTQNELIYENRF